jgi:hypothetical protein
MIFLTVSTSLIFPVSGSLHDGKSSYFEYYHSSDDWHTYVKFSVEEWDSSEGIATIRVTNESAIQDYRLKIPEWSIVDSEGEIISRWPYCPIWLDVSPLEVGMVFNDTDYWLCNFTVEGKNSDTCEIERITPFMDEYRTIEHLWYDRDSNRIRRYTYSIQHISYITWTVNLKYYPGTWTFTHAQAQFELGLRAFLIVGVIIELIVIVFFMARRLRK